MMIWLEPEFSERQCLGRPLLLCWGPAGSTPYATALGSRLREEDGADRRDPYGSERRGEDRVPLLLLSPDGPDVGPCGEKRGGERKGDGPLYGPERGEGEFEPEMSFSISFSFLFPRICIKEF